MNLQGRDGVGTYLFECWISLRAWVLALYTSRSRLDPVTVKTILSLLHLGFGLSCLFRLDIFATSKNYNALIKIASASEWGTFLTLLGIALFASPIRGKLSRFLSLVSILTFAAISVAVTIPQGWTTGSGLYGMLALISFSAFVSGARTHRKVPNGP